MGVALLAFVVLMQGVNQLRSTIWSTTSPKAFKGKTLTGPLLVELLTAAITTANKSGGVLNVGSMWSAMVDAELSAAATAAQESYKEKTKELDGCMYIKQAQRIHQVPSTRCMKVNEHACLIWNCHHHLCLFVLCTLNPLRLWWLIVPGIPHCLLDNGML